MSFGFPKKEKLKSRKLIDKLFAEGRSVSKFPLKLFYIRLSEEEVASQFQVAVTAPKKKFKTAVQRNRIKRLLRESYRLNKHRIFNNIEGNFAFLFLYLGKETPEFHELQSTMLLVFEKFLSEENHAKTDQ